MARNPSFIDLPRVSLDSLGSPRIVIFGASEGSPYVAGERSHSADGPMAFRAASMQFAGSLGQYDFDSELTLFPDDDRRGLVDAGDVPTNPWDAAGNRARIAAATRSILSAGALPVLLGGDDSVPIAMLAGYRDAGPLTILQIDAHVDWADALQGNPFGYGSTMRRVAEYPWVRSMVQLGMRGLGSGEAWQHDDARAWGSKLISSYEYHACGPAAVLDHIEPGATVVLSIDCDGIDPAVFPAVNMPTPGGLDYEDIIILLRGLAAKAVIGGLALVEYVPTRDDRDRASGLVGARVATVAMALARDAMTRAL